MTAFKAFVTDKARIAFTILLHSALFVAAVLLPYVSIAQNGPYNQLNTLGPVGIPPKASTTGTNERISLATGSLYVYLPALSVPQRGGWNLQLGYVHDSNTLHPFQNMRVSSSGTGTNGTYIRYQNFVYNDVPSATKRVLEPNLPRLQASLEYQGAYKNINDYTNTQPALLNFCVTNWTFTDWSGTPHQFNVNTSCSDKQINYLTAKIADSVDGSFYHFDVTNPNDAVITAKDGTQYHFQGNNDYYSNIPVGQSAGASSNLETVYDSRQMTMIDVNGNSLSVVDRADQTTVPISAWTITDTLGRQVSIGQDGVDYKDSNSTPRHINLSAPTAGDPLAQPLFYGDIGCHYLGTSPPYGPPTTASGASGQSSAVTSVVTLSMPISDSSGTARSYKMKFDPAGHLIRIDYPAGGYTRYDFTNYPHDTYNGGVSCLADMFQVSTKYACTSSAGSCGGEDTTTYNPSSIVPGDSGGNSPYNAVISETGPTGKVIKHQFMTAGPTYTSPLETDVSIANSSGKVFQTVHTDFTGYQNYTQLAYPNTITTTLNDSALSSSSKMTLKYEDTYILQGPNGPITVPLDNPTEMDSYGFQSKLLSTTTQSWKPASSFSKPNILSLVDTKTTVDKVDGTSLTTVYQYDTLGNVHSVSKTGSDGQTSGISFGAYTNGNPASMTDANGNQTTFEYNDSWNSGSCDPPSNTGAYLTKVILADGLAPQIYSYNSCTGTKATYENQTAFITSYGYDAIGRLTSVNLPGFQAISTSFADSIPNLVTVTTSAAPSPDIVSVSTSDGFGRLVSSVTGDTQSDNVYDPDGRVARLYNPKKVGSSDTAYTQYGYDLLDHVILTTYPDLSTSTNQYQGEVELSKDEIGNTKVLSYDASGQLSQVCEVIDALSSGEPTSACASVTGSANSGYVTSYSYSGRSSLLNVTSRSQTRQFTYDSLNRLVTAQNPETGTLCYGLYDSNTVCSNGYDGNGNLLHKTDARGAIANYTYDVENRITQKDYPTVAGIDYTPKVTYEYDYSAEPAPANIQGNLAYEKVFYGGLLLYQHSPAAYDPFGRVVRDRRCVPGACGNTNVVDATYTYDLAGHEYEASIPYLGSDTHPFTLDYRYDSSGRLTTVTGLSTNDTQSLTFNFLHDAQYSPFGGISSLDGIETRHYDLRGRISDITYNLSPFGVAPYTATYNSYFKNGNLQEMTDSINGHWIYTYDALNRLKTANVDPGSSPSYTYTGISAYTYDSFGNRLAQDGIRSNAESYGNANNHADCLLNQPTVTGCYDAAGNQTADIGVSTNNVYRYDAEGRLSGVNDGSTQYSYVYDGEGQRIAEYIGTDLSVTPIKAYLREPNGQFYSVIKSDGTGPVEVFGAGRHLASISDDVYVPFSDALGTERVRLGGLRGSVQQITSIPFGDLLMPGPVDPSPLHFTGKERDSESGLDYFGARYYASSMGRWMSPDPLNLTNARLLNPQTLNKYGYAANNPLKYVDKDGQDITIFYQAPSLSSPTGHIFIGAVNTANGSAAFLDFHPAGNVISGPGSLQGNLQSLGANGINNAYASLTIQTNPGPETQKIVDAIDKINSGAAPDFSLLSNNCTTVCENVLHDVGLDFGDLSPQSFYTHAFIKFSPDMQTNPFKAFFPPSAPAHDYGSPRNFGVNYSTLLYNLVFQPKDNSSVTTTQQDSKDGVPIGPCGGSNPCNK